MSKIISEVDNEIAYNLLVFPGKQITVYLPRRKYNKFLSELNMISEYDQILYKNAVVEKTEDVERGRRYVKCAFDL